jgi:hypothetical protein
MITAKFSHTRNGVRVKKGDPITGMSAEEEQELMKRGIAEWKPQSKPKRQYRTKAKK